MVCRREMRERRDVMSEETETVLYAVQVAHVTFFVTEQFEVEGYKRFNVYSETKREGKRLIEETFDQDFVRLILNEEIEKLEEWLKHHRKGMPTPFQLMFLFREKIPIPLTLTWGEASDIIDERLKQLAIEKEERKQAREEVRRKKEAAKGEGKP